MRFVRTAENLFGLPLGFQRVEYLESSGTQYIDTGFKPVPATTKFEFYFSPTTISGNYFPFGERPNTNIGAETCTTYFSTGNIRQDWAGLNTYFPKINAGDKVLYTAYNNTVSLNDNSVTGTVVRSTDRSNYNFLLFTVNTAGTADTRRYVGKVYYAKLWDDGTLVRDFIPCIDPLGVPCMYDLVGKKPYYNQGTGTFTAGRQIIPVEYLEGTGTQYIDTGVRGFADFEIGVKLRESVSNVSIFCGNSHRLERYNASNPYWRFRNGNDFYNSGVPITEYHVMAWKNDEVYADGVKLQDFTKTWSVPANMTLFGVSASGSYPSMVYFCKLWNPTDGSLLRDFIPAKDENNVGFLFDKVTGVCYLNNGTGSFEYGNEVYTSKLRLIKEAKELPDGYKRVEYIASSGTQYIDTGVYPTQLTEAEYRCAVTGSVANADSHLFGSRLSASSKAFDLAYMNTQPNGIEKFRFIHGTTTTQETTTSVTASQLANPHTYYMSGTSFKVDGSEKMSFTTSSFTGTYSLWLFGVNSAGSLHNQVRAQRVYKCKIWDNGTLVRSFIPVRDENNVGYMFDEVTGQLFGNAGSGSFVIGNDLPKPKVRFIQDVLPREYRPLKYLESTGTQWIDTGVNPENANTKQVDIETDFAVLTPGSDQYIGIFGAAVPRFGFYTRYNNMCFGYYQASDNIYEIEYGKKYNLRFNVTKGSQNAILDGVTVWTETRSGTLANTYTIGLFCRNYSTPQWRNNARIYNLTIAIDGTFVRDFYPALRKSDNKPGMYDRITKQFFINQGTGEFNYG